MCTVIEMLKQIEIFQRLENNRLVTIADRFISSKLTAFIKGRFISFLVSVMAAR